MEAQQGSLWLELFRKGHARLFALPQLRVQQELRSRRPGTVNTAYSTFPLWRQNASRGERETCITTFEPLLFAIGRCRYNIHVNENSGTSMVTTSGAA
jgi:hypothetical protein